MPGQKVWCACPEFSRGTFEPTLRRSTAGRPGSADAPGRGAGSRAQRVWEKPRCFHTESAYSQRVNQTPGVFRIRSCLGDRAGLPRVCKGAAHRAGLDLALVPVQRIDTFKTHCRLLAASHALSGVPGYIPPKTTSVQVPEVPPLMNDILEPLAPDSYYYYYYFCRCSFNSCHGCVPHFFSCLYRINF